MADKLSLKEIFEVLVKVVQELEKCMMFPSLLIDVPINNVGRQTSELFKSMLDCRDVYKALILVKSQVIDGYKRQWDDLNKSDNPCLSELGQSFCDFYCGLQSASSAAAMLSAQYRGAIEGYPSYSRGDSPVRSGAIEESNFFSVLKEFECQIRELEDVILIPSMLYDLHNEEIMEKLKQSGLVDVMELSSLRDVFSFLLNMRDQMFTPRSELKLGSGNQPMWRKIEEMYVAAKDIVEISCSVMQKYLLELERSTGEKWNASYQKLCIAHLQTDLGDMRDGRIASIMDRIEETMA